MNDNKDVFSQPQILSFYASAEHECSYLPGKMALSIFADPGITMTSAIYTRLAENGFRRSGSHVYAPQCGQCHACIPVRIPVLQFRSNRIQRRTLSKNQNLVVKQLPAEYKPEHFQLYQHYLSERHVDGGMDNPTPDSYMEFLASHWSETSFYEFRLDDKLIAISVADHLPRALSAVYTFFDPDYSQLSLGSYAILWLLQEAKLLGHEWLYLGYWIKDSSKMAYKDQYRPIEALLQRRWQLFEAGQRIRSVSR